MSKRIDAETETAVQKGAAAGKTIKELSKEFSISTATVSRIKADASKNGHANPQTVDWKAVVNWKAVLDDLRARREKLNRAIEVLEEFQL